MTTGHFGLSVFEKKKIAKELHNYTNRYNPLNIKWLHRVVHSRELHGNYTHTTRLE